MRRLDLISIHLYFLQVLLETLLTDTGLSLDGSGDHSHFLWGGGGGGYICADLEALIPPALVYFKNIRNLLKNYFVNQFKT